MEEGLALTIHVRGEKEVEYLPIDAEKGIAVFIDEIAVRGEKEIEHLPIGAEKGIAVFIDEVAVRGDAIRSFLFGEGLWLEGTEAVDGEGRGEGVGRLERGAFGIALDGCAEKAQHLRLKFQKLPAPPPRRNLANLANDGVVFFRKHREQELAVKPHRSKSLCRRAVILLYFSLPVAVWLQPTL